MNGLYIHIPFCKSKCYYCDFYSVTDSPGWDAYVSALFDEMEYRNDYLTDKQIDTVYFGGGTPTLLSPRILGSILDRVKNRYLVEEGAEITFEANPDDLNRQSLQEYRSLGFNRISIGIQSFEDEHLKLMNRRHNATQAIEAVQLAADAGFSHLSIDLIYGIPGMTIGQWHRNLEIAAGLPVDHLSAYHLTIEPGTPFGRLRAEGKFNEITEDQSVDQFHSLLNILGSNGFEQYEISNFARNNGYSRHNTKYWTGESYLGLGPSAHSYNGSQRHWNPMDLAEYLNHVRHRRLPEGEELDPVMKRNEYVMTRLRTSKGIDEADFIRNFGESGWEEFLSATKKHLLRGDLVRENSRIRFNREAWFHSDGILSDLFLVT